MPSPIARTSVRTVVASSRSNTFTAWISAVGAFSWIAAATAVP
jgi:hypothetical protein